MNSAKLYHDNNDLQTHGVKICLKQYKDLMKWKTNASVLDIGCGDGSVTAQVVRECIPLCRELIGCDINQDMVDFARTHFSSPGVSFHLLDIAGPVPLHWLGRFHHIVSFYAMHWVQEQQKAFENIYNLLVKDGNCLILLSACGSIFESFRKLSKYEKWKLWSQNMEKFVTPYQDCEDPKKTVQSILEKLGFRNIQIKYELTSFQYGSLKEIRGGIKSLVPFEIPEELMEDYLDDILHEMEVVDKEKYNHTMSTSHWIHNFYSMSILMEK